MRRIDEVKDVTKTLDTIINKINESEIDLEPHEITNLNLTTICAQLTQISLSLAVIADELRDN